MTRSPDRLEIPELREARPDLRERLERLPPGHPSSPYEADGTRKPPTAIPRTDDHSAKSQPGERADDPHNPHVAGSFDDVVAACDRGEITEEQYQVLADAVADAIGRK